MKAVVAEFRDAADAGRALQLIRQAEIHGLLPQSATLASEPTGTFKVRQPFCTHLTAHALSRPIWPLQNKSSCM
jgi:hypothetical protein